MKTCRICGVEKRNAEFNKRKGSADGRRYYCKECDSLKNFFGIRKLRELFLRGQTVEEIKILKNLENWTKENKELKEDVVEFQQEPQYVWEIPTLEEINKNKKKKPKSKATPEDKKEFLVYCVYNPESQKVKIGKSFNFPERYSTLCTQSGASLVVVGVIFCESDEHAFHVETSIHDYLKKHRIEVNTPLGILKTEYFDFCMDVRLFVSKHFEDYLFDKVQYDLQHC